jgi:hypothetical protein
MWTATFVTLVVIGIIVAAHEWYEYEQMREATRESYVKDFCKLLKYYEDHQHSYYGSTISSTEVTKLQTKLDKLAKRVAVYYPGFTAPTLV